MKIISTAAFLLIGTIVSIYNYVIPSVDTSPISFSKYQHKKILIVNTASGSDQVNQLAALQQLYMQHKDSMVIIAFPSNSFGNEPLTDSAIKIFMQQSHGITFPIAAKSDVQGKEINDIYKWLQDKLLNGTISGTVSTDFKKFLIGKRGKVIGQFDSSVSPLSTMIRDAIKADK